MEKSSRVLAVLPLDEAVLFPGGRLQLALQRPRLLALVEEVVRDHQELVLVARRLPGAQDPGVGELFQVGTTARVTSVSNREGMGCVLEVEGLRRVRLVDFIQKDPYVRARIVSLPDSGGKDSGLPQRVATLRQLGARVLRLEKRGPEAEAQLKDLRHPGQLADALAQALDAPVEAKQEVLEAADLGTRVERARLLVLRRRKMLGRRSLPSPYLLSYLLTAAVLGAHLHAEQIGWRTPMGGALWLVEAVSALGLLVELVRWLR